MSSPSLIRIRSFLINRVYRVENNEVFSGPYVAILGLPQGSALDPFLFILFINDISKCKYDSEFLLFADDLQLFKFVNSTSGCALLHNYLNRLGNWSSRNILQLNFSKRF